jgi:OmpA-OmpF porin, OOP family
MKCNWRRWLWGVIPVVILTWVALQAERPRIEQELTEAASAQVALTGASWARVSFEGRDGVLAGKAWDEDDAAATLDILRKQRGVRIVDSKTTLIDKAYVYGWSASRRNHRIRLSGYVPNSAVRKEILGVTKANFPGYEVADRMSLMRGVPAADIWLGGVSFALAQLSGMRRGEVRLDDLTLSIVGEADDLAALKSIRTAAANPPKGIKINLDQLGAPSISPYVWTAKFAGGKFDLSGYFPDEAVHTQLVDAARVAVRDGAVTDGMQPGKGAPADWSRAALAAVRALAKLEDGSAELKDTTLLVSGVSADEAGAEAVRTLLRSDLPSSFKFTEQIRPREPRKATATEPPRPPEPPKPLAKVETPAKIETPAKVEAPAKVEEPPKVPAKSETPVQPEAKVEAPSMPKSAEPVAPKIETKAEVQARTCQAILVEVIQSGHILFESASAELDDSSSTTLAKVADAVKSCPDVIVTIEGHTDYEGTQRNNQTLSLQRAQSVLDYLVKAGVNAGQLEPVGYGKTRPIAPNNSTESRAKNRRIEFVVRPK